ncbi:RloB family protein [Streptacidiphilus sp. P02-A3a]|uniref:RloB family protein n=1 Tax=Streptacidiphilus sp. P02-A3a TaxID=2704468 RepID=UPI0015FA7DE8|nr:RloB family protein [Streptacidiphilus sp. P02-A3a]QMU68141.1 RloB domain-containing protein [Streptacidiphilus sp. P02-A3a]
MAREPKPSGRRGPSFESTLGRAVNSREPRERLLVVCGAKVTERDYIQGLCSVVRNPAVSVKVIEHPRSPSQVVAYAAQYARTTGEEYDQTWCVLDVDQFVDIDQAQADADAENIHIALSNPCFELWLILHFADHRSHAASYKQLESVIARCLPGKYSKTGLRFADYQQGWPDAVRRAKQLAAPGHEARVNPATGMWRLALAIGDTPARGAVRGERR